MSITTADLQNTFLEDLEKAVAYHGHLCSGQVLGTRMARLGLAILGIKDPANYRDLISYVECDRCIADAIGIVTDCKIGRRRLKWLDYGKVAAAFLDLQTGKAIRVYRYSPIYPPEGGDLVEFFEGIPDEDLFRVTEITIPIPPEDLPGKPLCAEFCEICGEEVIDNRHLTINGHIFCKSCYQGNYYQLKNQETTKTTTPTTQKEVK